MLAYSRAALALGATALLGGAVAETPPPLASPPVWGAHGHTIAGRAAARSLPEAMPAFFRDAGEQLAYLNSEPDRWRVRELPAMDQGWSYGHYIDLENVPRQALEAEDRWSYLRYLYRETDLERPERDAGFLPYRILELQQRLTAEWRLWRAASPEARPWIEERIVNDAGILGHYVTDASQPHHTTIHFDGWAERAPNPEGFSVERGFHSRFETRFVDAAVTFEDVAIRFSARPRRLDNVRRAVMEHILAAHRDVPTLYRLDRDVGFDPERPRRVTRAFAVERLVAGAEMLRDLWWTAWLDSAASP